MNKDIKEKDSTYWDKKSEIFPRYNPKKDEFQRKILNILKKEKVIDKNSSILDIGCGTGVYTIAFAKEVKSVLGFDLSNKMLDFLKEDAWNNNIKNITTLTSNLDDFVSKEEFDFVFASKTPAIKEEKDYLKMESFSKNKVAYLGFAGLKSSNIQKELQKRYNFDFRVFDDASTLKEWLIKNNRKFSSNSFKEVFSRQINKDIATTHINEYTSNFDVKLSSKEIEDILKSLEEDGELFYRLDVKLELLLWEK